MASAAGVEQARVAVGDAGPADLHPLRLAAGPQARLRPVHGLTRLRRRAERLPGEHLRRPVDSIDQEPEAGRDRFGGADGGRERAAGGGRVDPRSGDVSGTRPHDIGGGVRLAPLGVNGVVLANKELQTCDLIAGTATGADPCALPSRSARRRARWTRRPPHSSTATTPSSSAPRTSDAPELRLRARDGHRSTTRPPDSAFRISSPPSDPELIVADAADQTSGLDAASASIEFRPRWRRRLATTCHAARRRTVARSRRFDPRCPWRLRVSGDRSTTSPATTTTTTARANGQPMVLSFPLKEAASLDASLDGARSELVPFRSPARSDGRLLDADGDPIAGAEVTVTETFAARLAHRGADADRDDERAGSLRVGPARRPVPRGGGHYGGSPRYQPDSTAGLDFQVRADATLRTSKRRVKAGDAVSFLGRVKRYYAQIPPGGKLVEVQVKSGDDWTTIHQAATDEREGQGRTEAPLPALLRPARDVHVPPQGHRRSGLAVRRRLHVAQAQGHRGARDEDLPRDRTAAVLWRRHEGAADLRERDFVRRPFRCPGRLGPRDQGEQRRLAAGAGRVAQGPGCPRRDPEGQGPGGRLDRRARTSSGSRARQRSKSTDGGCDPTFSARSFACATVVLNLTQPSRVLLMAGGGQYGDAGAAGACKFLADTRDAARAAPPAFGTPATRGFSDTNGLALTAVAGRVDRIQPGHPNVPTRLQRDQPPTSSSTPPSRPSPSATVSASRRCAASLDASRGGCDACSSRSSSVSCPKGLPPASSSAGSRTRQR